MRKKFLPFVLLLAFTKLYAQDDSAYYKVAQERSDKIVANMDIASDVTKSQKVVEMITQYYVMLNNLHTAAEKSGRDKAELEAEISGKYQDFLKQLNVVLSPDQVDEIKNGMTYHTVPLTYGNYLLMLPYLTKEHQEMIHANLLEARELAVNAGSAKGKHALFNKYKGRIANQLAADGYDLKYEGQQWAKRRDSSSTELAITESNRIVDSLGLTDKATRESVRNLLAHQYQAMEEIYAYKKKRTEEMERQQLDSVAEEKLATEIWLESKSALDKQRDVFIQTLASWLDSNQVDLVKNEMTKNGVSKELQRFEELLPNLTVQHKAQVFQYLLEARENALNVLTNRERNQWFIKYRGRANNYLSKEGYDLRKATEELERKKGIKID